MEQMLLMAVTPTEQIYGIIGDEGGRNGVVVGSNYVTHVPLWGYLTRVPDIVPISSPVHDRLWSNPVALRLSATDREKVKHFLTDTLDVKFPTRNTDMDDDFGLTTKSARYRLETKAKFTRKFEPYDPDAQDGDGDGIVQDGTPWERPALARIIDAAGRELRRGLDTPKRPAGSRIVDPDGKPVNYTPAEDNDSDLPTIGNVENVSDEVGNLASTPQAPRNQPGQPLKSTTPLSDHGASTLKERGLRSVRDRTKLPEPAKPGEVEEVKPVKPEKVEEVKPKTPKDQEKLDKPALLEDGDLPGHTIESADRPDLVKPEKPRSPYTPAPPPLAGRAQEIADEADGDYGKFMELLNKEGFVVFDYETTGLQDGNIPVQIGAVRVQDGKIVERFNVFTNPERALSDWSKANLKNVDGEPLTDEWLANQQSLSAAHQQLADFLGDSIIVAHNLPYDGEIITRMMAEADIDYTPGGSIDTLSLLRTAVPKGDDTVSSHGLGSLTEFFDVNLGDAAHTADADSEATAEMLQKAMAWAAANGSTPDIFDADKQKALYEDAKKKHAEQRKKYEADLAQYQLDLDEYQRAVAKATNPSSDTPAVPKVRDPRPSDKLTGHAKVKALHAEMVDKYGNPETMDEARKILVKLFPNAKITVPTKYDETGHKLQPAERGAVLGMMAAAEDFPDAARGVDILTIGNNSRRGAYGSAGYTYDGLATLNMHSQVNNGLKNALPGSHVPVKVGFAAADAGASPDEVNTYFGFAVAVHEMGHVQHGVRILEWMGGKEAAFKKVFDMTDEEFEDEAEKARERLRSYYDDSVDVFGFAAREDYSEPSRADVLTEVIRFSEPVSEFAAAIFSKDGTYRYHFDSLSDDQIKESIDNMTVSGYAKSNPLEGVAESIAAKILGMEGVENNPMLDWISPDLKQANITSDEDLPGVKGFVSACGDWSTPDRKPR